MCDQTNYVMPEILTPGSGNTASPEIRILVAEDNPSNYKLVEVILRRDYLLSHAENGEQAVEMYKREHPALILMDISMPVMDGYEALEQIRRIDAEVPVVALTAFAFETDRQKMMQAGFNCCLAKPLRIDELKETIRTLLKI